MATDGHAHQQLVALKEYYEKKYPEPTTDNEAINQLIYIYKTLMGSLSKDVGEGIAEYYRVLKSENQPAYHWILEAIHKTAKKTPEKRTFPYLVGMLRNWLRFGFGHMPSREESEVVDYLEEVVEQPLSNDARRLVRNYMSSFGALKVMRMIGALLDADKTYAYALMLGELLDQKYNEKKEDDSYDYDPTDLQPPLVGGGTSIDLLQVPVQQIPVQVTTPAVPVTQPTTATTYLTAPTTANVATNVPYSPTRTNTSAPVVTPNVPVPPEQPAPSEPFKVTVGDLLSEKHFEEQKVSTGGKVYEKEKPHDKSLSEKDERVKSESDLALLILSESKKPLRLAELFKHLEEYGIRVEGKQQTNKIRSYMRFNPEIIRTDTGLYHVKR